MIEWPPYNLSFDCDWNSGSRSIQADTSPHVGVAALRDGAERAGSRTGCQVGVKL